MVGGAVLTRWLVTLTFRSLAAVESTADAISAGVGGAPGRGMKCDCGRRSASPCKATDHKPVPRWKM